MPQLSREDIIIHLTRLRPLLAKEYGVDVFGLVGSRARKTANADSDIDVTYRRIEGRIVTLLSLGGVWNRLHEELGQSIDLIDWQALRPAYRDEMKKDLIRFYG